MLPQERQDASPLGTLLQPEGQLDPEGIRRPAMQRAHPPDGQGDLRAAQPPLSQKHHPATRLRLDDLDADHTASVRPSFGPSSHSAVRCRCPVGVEHPRPLPASLTACMHPADSIMIPWKQDQDLHTTKDGLEHQIIIRVKSDLTGMLNWL